MGTKTKNEGGKRISRGIVIFALVVALVIVYFALRKTDEEIIIERIESFEESYNNGDLEGFVENFSAKERRRLQAELSIANTLLGSLLGFQLDLSDLFSLGIGMQDADWLDVEVQEVKIKEDSALVKTNWKYVEETFGGTSLQECEMYFSMSKEDSDWFVKDITEDIPTEWALEEEPQA